VNLEQAADGTLVVTYDGRGLTKLMLAAHLHSQDRLSESGGRGGVSTVVGQAAFETAGSLEATA